MSDIIRTLRSAPLVVLTKVMLYAAIIALPFAHLIGVVLLLVTTALSLPRFQWRLNDNASALCIPLAAAYALVLVAELMSPNSFAVTLETAFNYLPLLMLPIIFAGCWRNAITITDILTAVVVASLLMVAMALVEIFIAGQPFADGNVYDFISISASEFALVAFIYGMIIMSGFFVNNRPFVNRIDTRILIVGVACCLASILLTQTRVMWVPISVMALLSVFTITFNSTKRWLAPSLLVILIFSAIALSGLPVIQSIFDGAAVIFGQVIYEPRQGFFAEKIAKWAAGWNMAQSSAVFGYGNIHATLVALNEHRLESWPVFFASQHFDNAFIDHMVLFGGLGLAGLLIALSAPLVVSGPAWFRLYAAIFVLGSTIYALLGRFLNNDITGATMLVMWLSLLMIQALVNQE